MEELITSMGLQFRNLIQHSDRTWSCQLMQPLQLGHKKVVEFWGDSAMEALQKAAEALNSFDD